jgi:hypothetical protein
MRTAPSNGLSFFIVQCKLHIGYPRSIRLGYKQVLHVQPVTLDFLASEICLSGPLKSKVRLMVLLIPEDGLLLWIETLQEEPTIVLAVLDEVYPGRMG